MAIALHIPGQMPNRANQTRGKQHGQENLEEVEEDRSDKAVDEHRKSEVSPEFHGQERRSEERRVGKECVP